MKENIDMINTMTMYLFILRFIKHVTDSCTKQTITHETSTSKTWILLTAQIVVLIEDICITLQ